jgi:hypothetical protein
MWRVVELVGRIVAALVGAAVLSVAVALVVAWRVYRGHWAPLKRFSVFVLDFLYLPLKALFGGVKRLPKLDAMMVALKNRANQERFKRSRRRLLLAPQCLRHLECPAPSTRRGILCQRCGQCKVAAILGDAEPLGYRFYLLTGSSFVPRIVQDEEADAALLVACPYECNKVMMALGRLATYGVALERDGCVSTDVSLEKVAEAMRLGLDEEEGSREGAQPGA